MKKILAIILVLALALSCFAACGGNTANKSSEPAEDTAEYAIILKTLSNDFWASMKTGIEEEAAKLGVKVDIYAAQSEDDTEGQVRIFENCLNKGYKAIGVAPLSPVNIVSSVVKANEKGIYVMNIDEKIDMDTLKAQGGSVIAFATTDNVKVGAKGAGYIIDQLSKTGEVAIIEGKAGNASGEDRRNGARAAFEAESGIKVVESQPADWDRQKALDVATTYIQKHPDLKGIYCCNDTMALGALQAVKNANKMGEIIVVGTDGAKEALESIKAGELNATVAQDPALIGATSLKTMIDAVKAGKKIDSTVEPTTIPVDSTLVTE